MGEDNFHYTNDHFLLTEGRLPQRYDKVFYASWFDIVKRRFLFETVDLWSYIIANIMILYYALKTLESWLFPGFKSKSQQKVDD